ncbi:MULTISPECIES: phospholipase C [Methylosinus]|uniref:Phosphoesterase n=1 Tax=Methylosinus trichosporium (strain ATCC 35070 / NCIMB 11131 / UNIQEM 75 / OB3b) TaxID=595536 RepID=A0A2D2D5W2_METT3|nr:MULTISPECIES: alkaline phosphatase family protein [Methylosinus]ATQ70363.1 phosphoesterase [Methylosinus trichosporium OB3b]OBS51048.1 phosphoesterase [Methylosinus sp. 3S-1]
MRSVLRSICLATTALCAAPAFAGSTVTPIRHVIIIVGENHTFDNVFGTYQPTGGQTVHNLLSQGIVNADGTPGPNFKLARQRIGSDESKYLVETPSPSAYSVLPQPWTTYALFQPAGVRDSRFPIDLPNGPYQITKYAPYSSFTGDPVHRFFQMWQQIDGGKHDKFVWVEKSIGTGTNGNPVPAKGFNPKEGAISMGFYNMNPYQDAAGVDQPGDAQIFKALADRYAISDNFHQSIMGGTGANFQAIVSGHAAFFTNPTKLDGSAAVPWQNQIENPDPLQGTNNYYTQDGYSGGSYVKCADSTQPGVSAVVAQLKKNKVKTNCASGHYYLVNNYNMYWNQTSDQHRDLGSSKFVLPPQTAPTIADVLTRAGVSWKYYSSDRGDDATKFADSVDGVPLLYHSYCGICDPLTGYKQIMTRKLQEAKLQNYGNFLQDIKDGTLPAVSFVRPFEYLAGHPANSNNELYEQFVDSLIKRVKSNRAIWDDTAIFVTYDEGGGYYDSGYVQPVDFFGDGTRIPLIVVSPYAKKGYVDHTYYDHVSMLKFIEHNWKLGKISSRSRDNLPNPVHTAADPYVPTNIPAIGDMMNMFNFPK